MDIEPFLIASSLILVISQRLVRRLCEKCKKQQAPEKDLVSRLGLTPEQASKITFYEPGGCDECLQTGYRGRLPLFEVMTVDDELAKLIIQRVDATVIKEKSLEQGMTTLSSDGVRKIGLGLTTAEEVIAVAYAEEAEKEDVFKPEPEEGEEEPKEKSPGEATPSEEKKPPSEE